MKIRPATLSDARAVAEVNVLSWQHAYRGLIPNSYLDQLSVDKRRETAWQRAIDEGTPELWVAEKNSSILGWVAFGAARDEDALPTTGEIRAFYILPTHWRQGAGRALWLAAQRRLVERHFVTATLWVLAENQRAIHFYRSIGFLPGLCSERTIEIGGKKLTEVRYEAAIG